ncbi:MAG: SDR family oxidoreductase [Acetobacteraceae bacterium]
MTGGSKGLGLAIATRMAASGANVAILARDPDALEAARVTISQTARGKVAAFSCDVRRAEDITRTHQAVLDAFGKVDILVNNAGTSRTAPFETVTDEIWQEDLDLKLFAAIRLTRLVWQPMKQQQWGRVINVLNTGAKAPRPGSAPTAVSRAAGMALTKVLAGEGAPHNVLVNALLVGLIVSDQWVRRHREQGANVPFEDFTRDLAKGVPMGRMGTAEEFANITCFLASDAASYITGTAINVDGGSSPVV